MQTWNHAAIENNFKNRKEAEFQVYPFSLVYQFVAGFIINQPTVPTKPSITLSDFDRAETLDCSNFKIRMECSVSCCIDILVFGTVA